MPNIPPDLAWRLADQLGHATAYVAEDMPDLLEGSGLTPSAFVALVVLSAFPDGLTQSEWGRLQGVTRQRAHTVAKQVVGAGLVKLTKQGRTATATLTAAGTEAVNARQPRMAQAVSERLNPLTPAEAQRLSDLLAKLLQHEPRGQMR